MWDTVTVAADENWTVASVKEAALRDATARTVDPSEYIVKFRGAQVLDEERSLGDLGVPDRGPLIVLPHKRSRTEAEAEAAAEMSRQ